MLERTVRMMALYIMISGMHVQALRVQAVCAFASSRILLRCTSASQVLSINSKSRATGYSITSRLMYSHSADSQSASAASEELKTSLELDDLEKGEDGLDNSQERCEFDVLPRKEFVPANGCVYMVATPIGNLGDLSYRAAAALRHSDCICAEDTRHTRQLLTHILAGQKRKTGQTMLSHHEHNWRSRVPQIVQMALSGSSVCVVSDAGSPGISDPGAELAAACAAAGIPLSPIPGPSSPIAALSISGFESSEFTFFGFVPVKGKERSEKLARIMSTAHVAVFFEAPHRVAGTFDVLASNQADRDCVVCRELTKVNEDVLRGSVAQCRDQLVSREKIRGEFTIVLGRSAAKSSSSSGAEAIETLLLRLRGDGVQRSAAVKLAAELMQSAGESVSRSEIYRVALNIPWGSES